MTRGLARVDAFVFHTRLVHISALMRDADPSRAMEKLALVSQGWSGGTRIGGALADFNRDYAPRLLSRRSIVLIMSDGYDTGSVETLEAEMRRLKRRAGKLVWLNPLLGRADYAPVTERMAAARRHVDLFLPAHNLRSLLALEDLLVRF